MQTIMRIETTLQSLLPGTNNIEALIFKMLPAALSNVPFHHDTENITRYFAENFPLHLAVHEVSRVSSPPEKYTLPPLHIDSDEINIVFSSKKLLYQIQVA